VSEYTAKLRKRAEEVNEASLGLLQSLEQTSNTWIGSLSTLLALDDAAQLKDGIAKALQQLPPPNSLTQLATAIVGLSEVRTLKYQADLIDLLWGSGNLKQKPVDRRSTFQQQMTLAAAKGDWNEWDRVVDEYTTSIIAGSNDGGGEDSGGGTGEEPGPS